MTDIVIIAVVAVLLGVAVRHIYRSVRYGRSCCGNSMAKDKKIRVQDKNKAHYPYSYKLKVEGMVCAGCVRKVENTINADGRLWAKVDLEHKEVNVLAKKKMQREDFFEILKTTSYTMTDFMDIG